MLTKHTNASQGKTCHAQLKFEQAQTFQIEQIKTNKQYMNSNIHYLQTKAYYLFYITSTI
jgi:hypothetical protein